MLYKRRGVSQPCGIWSKENPHYIQESSIQRKNTTVSQRETLRATKQRTELAPSFYNNRVLSHTGLLHQILVSRQPRAVNKLSISRAYWATDQKGAELWLYCY